MKTPIKINQQKIKNDLLEISFSFPEETQHGFSMQIYKNKDTFDGMCNQINAKLLKLTNHIQSLTAEQSKLRIYNEGKQLLINEISNLINNFLLIQNKNSLISMSNKIKHQIAIAIDNYHKNAKLLKDTYKYEHVYLKEMLSEFEKIKYVINSIFTKYLEMMDQIKTLKNIYGGVMKINFSNSLKIEEFKFKNHQDLSQVRYQNSLGIFIQKCLELEITEDFSKIDSLAQEQFDSLILDEGFCSSFKQQPVSVEFYLSEYKNIIKTQQQLLDPEDYRTYFYKKSVFLTNKNKVINNKLQDLWRHFVSHFDYLLESVKHDIVLSQKIKKQILKLTLSDFFSLSKEKIMVQAISDVLVEDFEESFELITWHSLQKQDPAFCSQFETKIHNKFSEKYSVEEIADGVFLKEEDNEFTITMISINQKHSSDSVNFIKKIENKYQKKVDQVKSVSFQTLADMLDLHYNNSKIIMPIYYHIFRFKDSGLLQGFKKISKYA